MPKGRMLNKKISSDNKVAELGIYSAFLFTWMIPFTDCEGRMLAVPGWIKWNVIPLFKGFNEKKIKSCLTEISSKGLIKIYGEKSEYLQMNGFFKNQSINKEREALSDIPAPDQLMSSSRVTPLEVEVEVKEEVKAKVEVEVKHTHLDFVLLKPSEYEKLTSIYNRQVVDKYIEKLNSYIGSNGRKYKSHYYTLIAWLQKDEVQKIFKKKKTQFELMKEEEDRMNKM